MEKFVEVVVSDNNSSDGTEAVVRSFTGFQRLKYFRNEENVGPSRNFGLAISRGVGEYIWTLADDDAILPDSIGNLLVFLRRAELDYVFIPRILADRDLKFDKPWVQPRGVNRNTCFPRGTDLFNALDGQMPTLLGFFSSTVIRRSLTVGLAPGSFAGSEFAYMRVVLTLIATRPCGILGAPGVICRIDNYRGFAADSRVWLDDYVETMLYVKRLGYDQRLCDTVVIRLIRNGAKYLVLDKIRGRRNETMGQIAHRLSLGSLVICRTAWWWGSFLPMPILGLLRPVLAFRRNLRIATARRK